MARASPVGWMGSWLTNPFTGPSPWANSFSSSAWDIRGSAFGRRDKKRVSGHVTERLTTNTRFFRPVKCFFHQKSGLHPASTEAQGIAQYRGEQDQEHQQELAFLVSHMRRRDLRSVSPRRVFPVGPPRSGSQVQLCSLALTTRLSSSFTPG